MKLKGRSIILTALFFWLFGGGIVQATDPSMDDYTNYPMFISSAIKPNVLIIFDNSGSMNYMAYGYYEEGSYHPDDFGAVAAGIVEGGDDSALVDSNANFTDTVSEGDILHNINDGSTGTILSVSDDNTLIIDGTMSDGKTNDSGEQYRIEHSVLKDPTQVENGYYGYFIPTARYLDTGSNYFARDDDNGDWSGNFLNWLTMRRVDVARKVLMGGLATARTGGGNQRLIGETPAQTFRIFLKIVEDPTEYAPYDNRHFYRIAGGDIEVYKLDDGEPDFDYTKDFTYTGGGGVDQILADYVFDETSNDTYEISLTSPIVSGFADGIVDNPRDQYAIYKYFLFDPDTDFREVVNPGDSFENEIESTVAEVGAVPATEVEILDAMINLFGDVDGKNLLFDMFKYKDKATDGDNDGYLKCTRCTPPEVVDYNLCQAEVDPSGCYDYLSANTNLLSDLVGHLVFFKAPIDPAIPLGNNAPEKYNFYRRAVQATRVETYTISVARDQTKPDEDRDFKDGNLAGVMQKIGDRARFGLEFNNTDQGGRVVRYVGNGTTDLINLIQNQSNDTESPQAESLYEGIRYFQQESPYYFMGDFTRNNTWDPYYFNDLGRFVECSKSFILHITDGKTSEDLDIPDLIIDDKSLRDYDNDGNEPGTYDSNGSDYLDDVALWAHTTDLRADLEGEQNVTYYTVQAFGRGSKLLQDAARNGGFWDVDGDNRPEPPDGDPEKIRMEWDRDQDGVPDTYFAAPNGYDLESQLLKAITAILERAASGTAVSVLSTSDRGEGTLYQAFFKPLLSEGDKEIKWLGYLQSLWVDSYGNIREDTVSDGRLILSEDKIIKYWFDEGTKQTKVYRYTDDNGNGKIDADENSVEMVNLENVASIWEAGRLLALRDPDDRKIFTFADVDWDGVGERVDFDSTTANLDKFKDYLDVVGTDSNSYSYLGAYDTDDDTTEALRAGALVSFIRGEQVSGLRNRQVTVDGAQYNWKLGDIVASSPTVVTRPSEGYDLIYGDSTYGEFVRQWKDRQAMVYIGANDGMLHAFKAGRFIAGDDESTVDILESGYIYIPESNLGTEAWAYVPFNLLPHLKWLANPDYTHVSYVDLKVKVADVRIFDETDGDHPDGWGTLLIGGMQFGGGPYPSGITVGGEEKVFKSAFFLIDVTNPEEPEVLAEFTHPDLGFTTSYPSIAKVGDNWYMIAGSGPTPGSTPPFNYDGTSNQKGKIFVLNLSQFMSTREIREGVGGELTIIDGLKKDAFMADSIGVDKTMNYSADVIYIGETYWASNRWNGTMYRIKTALSTNPADWVLSTLFQTGLNQAITAAPTAAVGYDEDLWVYFGTGRLYNEQDKADQNPQAFYGIHDACMEGGDCGAVSSILDVTDEKVFSDGNIQGLSGATDFTALEEKFRGNNLTNYGWKIELDPGERSLGKASILGGAVFFTTFTPDFDICSMGGEGDLYALYFLTGTAHYKPILDDKDAEANKELLKSVSMGIGMPASLGLHVGSSGGYRGPTGFIQTSTGNIISKALNPPLMYRSREVSWKQ